MKSHKTNNKDTQQDNDYQKHAVDLKEAIYYLPRTSDQDTLIRALKAVYPNEGQELMIEWLSECKFAIPYDFKEIWQDSQLTSYQRQKFDSWLKEEIYDVAEQIGWVPKALRKGKQAKKPPRRKVQKQFEENKKSTEKLHQNLQISRERELPEDQKSFSTPRIVNKYGGCYKQPFL